RVRPRADQIDLALVRVLRQQPAPLPTGAAWPPIWAKDQAQQALSLIADLPGSELCRCFLPGWGIRAHSSTDQLFEIAFCFRCHGARIWGPGLPVEQQGQTFDAESPAALELLHRFLSCLPD
ncbi:hypothetical protein ACIPD2_40095, partial [Streptomyces griseofuscus]|uniref:hypothetical protein n=1 Tax=Streptomyces griseofuscus TaxID=146922 RepID=UPI00380E8422